MRGILTLFRIRKTRGSFDFLPPSPKQLMKSFNILQNNQARQTVGSRALSKHFHRGEERFWGEAKGTDLDQIKHSVDILTKILKECCWLNVHLLPHDVIVFEIRQPQGYGARWIINNKLFDEGIEFRGFLEPQMENGHEIGWKH